MHSLVTTIYSFTNNTYKNRHLFIDNTTLIQFSRGCCRTKINYRYNDRLHKQNRVIYISVTATGITNGTDSLSPPTIIETQDDYFKRLLMFVNYNSNKFVQTSFTIPIYYIVLRNLKHCFRRCKA